MTRIIHLGTVVQTTFGMLDDDGNVTPQQPMEARLTKFDAASFKEAYGLIVEARDQAITNSAAQDGETSAKRPEKAAKTSQRSRPKR